MIARPYTVVGTWDGEEGDRFAECYLATSAPAAEQLARINAKQIAPDAALIIAGTVYGDVRMAS